jgi:hypothetical protein
MILKQPGFESQLCHQLTCENLKGTQALSALAFPNENGKKKYLLLLK